MKIALNGEPRDTTARSVSDLVAELRLPAATLLIEHNGDALPRSEWPVRALAEDDRIELLRIAAGG